MKTGQKVETTRPLRSVHVGVTHPKGELGAVEYILPEQNLILVNFGKNGKEYCKAEEIKEAA